LNDWLMIDAFKSISKVPPETASSTVPDPVAVVFEPSGKVSGVKPVILPCVAPQSVKVNFNDVDSATAKNARTAAPFIMFACC
jgi:hypothetical protein